MRNWFLFYGLVCASIAVTAEGKYYHMAYAGFRKDDPTTESMPLDGDKDRMGVLYRDPSIYQPSYYHKKAQPIEESVEVETYPLEGYSSYAHAEAPESAPAPPPSTAAPAAPAEQRQQPYSYYYIGRKLWYIPLYFSLYFVIYVAALIIRAITRHKVTFPDRLPAQARALSTGGEADTDSKENLDLQTANINQILEDMLLKYM